jgi:inactivated superfamily I helicase
VSSILPLHFSKGAALDKSPTFLALLGVLELHIKDYPRRLVLDTIRSPYFNLVEFDLYPESTALLDMVSVTRQVLGGRQVWLETLEALSHVAPDQFVSDDENYSIKLPVGEAAAALEQGLSRLIERLSPPERDQNLIEWVAWLEDLLEALHYWKPGQQPGNNALLTENGALLAGNGLIASDSALLASDSDLLASDGLPASNGLIASNGFIANDRTALFSFRQMLRELVLVETTTGEKNIEYHQFVQILRESAASQIIQQPSHMRQPVVMVLHTTEGRGLRHQAVAILGISEGLFPQPQRGDPFLDEETRTRLVHGGF